MADCDLVIANQVEGAALGQSIRAARAAIVTLGAAGCELVERGRRRLFPAEPVDAIDTTGCGDAFCGVIAALLARGVAIADAIPVAQKAAALTATREGAFAALPTRDELAAFLPNAVGEVSAS
jgi:ribokinase